MSLYQLIKLAEKFKEKYSFQEEINRWIADNVKDPYNKCFFYAAVISLLFPGLKLVKGKHSEQFAEDTAHFYLEDENGNIIDPTSAQYKPGQLEPGKVISAKKNIDFIINDPMFKSLSKKDQLKILQINKSI